MRQMWRTRHTSYLAMNVQIESWKKRLQPEFEKDHFAPWRNSSEANMPNTGYSRRDDWYQRFQPLSFSRWRSWQSSGKIRTTVGTSARFVLPRWTAAFLSPFTLVSTFEIKRIRAPNHPLRQSHPMGRTRDMLNATLTVRAHQAGSHQNRGWLRLPMPPYALAEEKEHLVFILWDHTRNGKDFHQPERTRYSLRHPSPLSAYNGFFGNKHFSQTNEYLKARRKRNSLVTWPPSFN